MDTPATQQPAPSAVPEEQQVETIVTEGPAPVEIPEGAIKEPPTEAEKVDELIETVAPVAALREQRILAPADSQFAGFDKTYVQKPLSFFGKTEFVRVVGKGVDTALGEGGGGLSITSLFGNIGSISDLSSTDVFVKLIARLAENAPELLKDAYMISLGVPRHERMIVSEIFDMPHDPDTGAGGLSDDDGFAILDTFVAQNAKTLTDFFAVRLRKTVKDVQEIVSAQTPAQ